MFREPTDCERYEDAKKKLQEKEGDVANGVPIIRRADRVTVGELLDALMTDYRNNDKPSIQKIEGVCKNHLRPYFGHWKACTVTDVSRYIEKRRANGAQNATINRELAALRRAFVLGVQERKILLSMKPYIPHLKENNVRTGFFECDQFESVRKHLPEELQPVITFAYLTGWRINSEILKLQWNQVDFKAGTVRLNPGATKNEEGRLFPFKVDAELTAVLDAQKAHTDVLQKDKGMICPWVFHRAGRPIKDYRKAWANACTAAGVPGRIPHDFRRTAVRNLERARVSRSSAMKLTGHKTEAVYRRYAIVEEADLAEAVSKLQALKSNAVDTVSDTVAHERVQNARETSA